MKNETAEIEKTAPFLYFEIKIKKMDKNSMIAIGISSKDCKQNESFLPGFKVGSFGLLNTGYLYCGDPATPIRFKENLSITTSFTTGDVIGCGYHQITKQIYWTKNGIHFISTIPPYSTTGLGLTRKEHKKERIWE